MTKNNRTVPTEIQEHQLKPLSLRKQLSNWDLKDDQELESEKMESRTFQEKMAYVSALWR